MFDIPGAISAVSNVIDTVVKRIWPDATVIEQAKIAQISEEFKNEFAVILGQLEINKEEAKSASVLVAGARPYVLWVCGTSLAYVSLLEPILRFLAVVIFGYTGEFPAINTDLTMQVLLGILGLGGYRTVEKLKGVSRDKIK